MNKIEFLLSQLILAADIARRAHWRTGVEATHEALGDFYDAVASKTDKFAESWMGEFQQKIPAFNIESDFDSEKDIAQALREILTSVRAVRDLVTGSSRPLINIMDEVEGEFIHTLYKLEQLI